MLSHIRKIIYITSYEINRGFLLAKQNIISGLTRNFVGFVLQSKWPKS